MSDKERFRAALEATAQPRIEPTEDEKRNGWDADSLTQYVAEQSAAQSVRMDPHSAARKRRPMRANSKYNPLRWRG